MNAGEAGQLLQPGAPAPPVDGVAFGGGPLLLFFYKVTCPVCHMAAPVIERFHGAYPGRVVGIGQDPEPSLRSFSREYGLSFRSVPDLPPYPASNAYGIRVVPTLALLGTEGIVGEVVESWDREGWDRASRRLAELSGAEYLPVSEAARGLAPFRPG